MLEFYNYISKIIIDYLSNINIEAGERYSIQLERQKEVDSIYQCLKTVGADKTLSIEDFSIGDYYNTYSITINGTSLIVAKTDNNIESDFLTYLRNNVDKKGTEFEGTALLFLHNTSLDSILGGTKRLEMEGMPLHVSSIEKKITYDINSSNLSPVDKCIVEIYLDRNRNSVHESHTSIFDYSDIFNILEVNSIDLKKYKDFGMFVDTGLGAYNMIGIDDSLKERIKDNMNLYKTIDQIHKYSDISELEQHFDSNDVSKVAGENWEDNNYDEIVKLKDKYDKLRKPEYIEQELKVIDPNCIIWDRPEGITSTKSRRRHVIIFNPQKSDMVSIQISFDAKIQFDNIKVANNAAVIINNKLIEVTLTRKGVERFYTKLTYFNFTFNIIVLDCNPELLSSIKDKYFVEIYLKTKSAKVLVIDDVNMIVLNEGKQTKENLILSAQKNYCDIDDDKTINITKNFMGLEDVDLINLELSYRGSIIPLAFKNELVKTIKITAYDVWKDKRLLKSNFTYEKAVDSNSGKTTVKLTQGTRSYYPIGEFRRLLDIEFQLINTGVLNYELKNNELVEREIDLPQDLFEAYQKLINYYKQNKIVPSLSFYNQEVLEIANNYIEIYFSYLQKLNSGSDKNKELYKEINKIGVIYENDGENKIHFTPLHPINVLYQIRASENIVDEDIEKGIAQYINSSNLVPYIQDSNENFYKQIDNGLIEWTTYVEYDNSKYNAANRYVSRIVSNKIKDFVSHFEYLFLSDYAPLKIAVVNLGDCKEVLQGIFEYYISELKTNRIEELKPIEIQIYDDDQTVSAFEEMTGYTDIEKMKDAFGIKLRTKDYDEYDVLSMYRNNVRFYKYPIQEIKYCHLTFYKMNDKVVKGSKNMHDIETGISLDGLVSDVSSVFVGKEYVTGFGSKNLSKTKDPFINYIVCYNSFIEYVNRLVTYDEKTVLATAISSEENEVLKKIYNKSHWVTFIDPKVDLNYFYIDEESKELMIIHYSDQYTSSSGYDAITVTQKSTVYMKIINDFLVREAKIKEDEPYKIREIINSFNVFNGEWLLRLVSRQLANNRDQFAREKLSLFAAVKLFEAYTLASDIFWVPISLEELVRVSGSTGLTQKDSIFSPKNFGITGSFSDDILMIGISVKDNEVLVTYYPIEVKIGNNGTDVLSKAKEQVAKAESYFNSALFCEDNFYAKLLRNQLMRMAVTQIKKIIMYDMWSSKDWSYLLNEEIIEKLINDKYKIEYQITEKVNDCGIITFTKNAITRRKQVIEYGKIKIDHFDYPLQDAHSYLALDLEGVCEINGWDNNVPVNPRLPVEIPVGIELIPPKPVIGGIQQLPPIYRVDEQNEMKILFGTNQVTKEEVYWLPNSSDKVMHTNTGIIGTMGTGKTQFTKSLITQIKQQEKYNVDGREIGILIFDYKGDYIKEDFVKATDATVYNLYNLPYNPLSIYQGKTFKPMLPLHTANELRDTIANAYNLGSVQKNTLSEVLGEAYESVGIVAHDPNTWSKDAPTIDTVFKTYMNAEYPTNDSLYAALNELNKFKIFEADSTKTKPLFELAKGVAVINLSGYSESIQNLIVAITLDTFYAQMQAQGHSEINGNYRQLTRMILVDEADNFLSKNFNSIRKILKEGREFGVGTILSTQFLKHFSTSDNNFSEYILTWIIHKVNEISAKEVGNIFSLTNKNDQDSYVNTIKNLEKHHSLINLGGDNVPRHIRDKAFWELKF